MLFSTGKLDGFVIAAADGEIGTVRHAYFDDERWVIRHLVVQAGSWLKGRHVLVSPHAVTGIEPDRKRLLVSLTRAQVEQAPDIDTDKPVSRQQEARYYDYYGYPYYWAGAGLWGAAALPLAYVPLAGTIAANRNGEPPASAQQRDSRGDPHLRSTVEVAGYEIEAIDGSIGAVEDFLFDASSWAILHVVVDTRKWLPGRKVLIDPAEIASVDWPRRHVRVRLTREQVKASDPYVPEEMLGSASHA